MNVNKLKEYVLQNKSKSAKMGVIVIVLVAAVFVFFFQTGKVEPVPLKGNQPTAQSASRDDNSAKDTKDAAAKDSSQKANDTVVVDIDGQVVAPQVVELPKKSRISDAIYAAGGLTKKADVSTINRAKILTDGEKIYIPAKGEQMGAMGSGNGDGGGSGLSGSDASGNGDGTAGTGSRAGSGGAFSNGKININTASSSQLQEITGVGPATAEKIIAYRQKSPFKSIEDLKNVNGIGDKTFEKMKDQVTI